MEEKLESSGYEDLSDASQWSDEDMSSEDIEDEEWEKEMEEMQEIERLKGKVN